MPSPDFVADPILTQTGISSVCGLNVAAAWPLLPEFRPAYEDMEAKLRALDDGLYVYPFVQTHITIATARSFKSHINPSAQAVAELAAAGERLGSFVAAIAADMAPVALEVGAPVLDRAAAYLPIENPGGEIASLRRAIADFCGEGVRVPAIIHSTILRFRRVPKDPQEFAHRFQEIAADVRFGPAMISRLLVTLETEPYMQRGTIVRAVELASAESSNAARSSGSRASES